ncbi:hypothetical protein ABW19_dt0202583 [Dactylella cylindrospora]|nr:hypothetical protein ABW19_dt0202583 [Dactylella cylindrospora]
MSSTESPAIIRRAVKEDIPEILAMVRELAEYEKDLASCKATEEQLSKSLGFTGGPAYAHTLMLCEGDKAVGIALYVS